MDRASEGAPLRLAKLSAFHGWESLWPTLMLNPRRSASRPHSTLQQSWLPTITVPPSSGPAQVAQNEDNAASDRWIRGPDPRFRREPDLLAARIRPVAILLTSVPSMCLAPTRRHRTCAPSTHAPNEACRPLNPSAEFVLDPVTPPGGLTANVVVWTSDCARAALDTVSKAHQQLLLGGIPPVDTSGAEEVAVLAFTHQAGRLVGNLDVRPAGVFL